MNLLIAILYLIMPSITLPSHRSDYIWARTSLSLGASYVARARSRIPGTLYERRYLRKVGHGLRLLGRSMERGWDSVMLRVTFTSAGH